MKKIISFSLYGNKPNFQVGAVVNVLEAKRLYPDWKCRFYTTDDDAICKQLEYLGAEIVRMDDWPEGQMFWRFLAVDDADVCLSRDADSVVNEREVGAVNEWLESDYQWHAMHDHRYHRKVSIMGGMWGCRHYGDNIPESVAQRDQMYIFDFHNCKSMREHIDTWLTEHAGSQTVGRDWDQRFLGYIYADKAQTNIMWHGGWVNTNGNPFPPHAPCRYGNFVGDYSFNINGWKGMVTGDQDKSPVNLPVTQENKPPEIKYNRRLDRVIVGCNSHPEYLDFWPLISAAWKKIDVKPSLFLVERPEEHIEVDETLGDVLRIKVDEPVHTAFASQCIRLMAPCLYPDENVVISDMDIVPLAKDYLFENLKRGPEDSFIEYRHGGAGGGQTAMCWNVAKGSVWGDIFNISATFENYQSLFMDKLKEWNPPHYRPIHEGKHTSWFTDQILLHRHLSDWDGNHIKLRDSDCNHRRLDHRGRIPGMHDLYTDFCPRRPLHRWFYPRFSNVHSIKHVADWYKIPWSYGDVWGEAYSNPEYCVVTFCNKAYLDETRRTIEGLRNQGRWAGDIVVMIGDDLKDEKNLFDEVRDVAQEDLYPERIIVKYFPDIDRTKAIELYKTLGGISDGREIHKPFQWHKIHCFQHFFKKWKKCLVIDGGMCVYNPIRTILDIDCEGQLLAHSDTYPNYNWRLSGQFDHNHFPELYEEISSKYDLDVDYFQGGLLMYDTSIINDSTFSDIKSLEEKYLNSRNAEMGVLNLYFNLEKKMWKQLPFNKNSIPYYDAICRTGNRADYIMTKR